ncbi:MAG: glucose 1-dehydrogenase [Ignavibacteriales bacterium]|nr:glucose 1-dehydrogenase [Ignavibacteriales bacterium]
MISLKGKISIITGGSRGIGAATAVLLAKAGSDVAINYIENGAKAENVVNCIKKLGRRVVTHRGDVGNAGVAKEFIEKTVSEFGRIDNVVNNAGIWTYLAMGSADEDNWGETIQTNLTSVFNVTNAAVPYLKKEGGRIVNVASTAGQRGEAFHSHYAASKGGILALTKSLAVELAPYKILVNAVAPGWVDTEMNSQVFIDQKSRDIITQAIPLRKIATAEDVAGSVLFLVSDLANHITGATINVNGGSVLN